MSRFLLVLVLWTASIHAASPAPVATAIPTLQATVVATMEPTLAPTLVPANTPVAPLALSPSVQAPAAPTILAPALPEIPADLGAPEGLSLSAQTLSGTAGSEDSFLPTDLLDPLAIGGQAPMLELKSLSTTALLKMVQALDKDTLSLSYDPTLDEVLAPGASSEAARSVDAAALYFELGHRLAYDNDAVAREALSMAALRGDPRGKEGKDLAFADKLADSLIPFADKGDAAAKAQLEKLATQGNRRAREYLGMDQPPMPVHEALSPTAQTMPASPTAQTMPLSPTAQALPLSPSAQALPASPTAQALPLSPTASAPVVPVVLSPTAPALVSPLSPAAKP